MSILKQNFLKLVCYSLPLTTLLTLTPNPLVAEEITWSTAARIDPYPLSTTPQYLYINNTASNASTSADYSGGDSFNVSVWSWPLLLYGCQSCVST